MRSSGREQPRQAPTSDTTPPRMQRGDPRDVPPDVLAAGYERLDVAPRHVVWALAAIGGLVVIAIGVVWTFDALYEGHRTPAFRATLGTRPIEPPAPRLEADPVAGGAAIAARNAADLAVYGWVDERRRIARVPIEEAMRLLATRGWPDPFEPADAVSAADREGRVPAPPLAAHVGRERRSPPPADATEAVAPTPGAASPGKLNRRDEP